MGMIVSSLFSYVLSIGWSIIILNQTQKSCAALFIASEQGLQEIMQLKYIAMKEAKRSEQNITAQKYIDQMNIGSVKSSIMRNYIAAYPKKYIHTLEYTNWEELEKYVDDIIKNGGKV